MKFFYNIETGRIINVVPNIQTMESYYFHYKEDFLKNIEEKIIDDVPDDWRNYKIINNELVKMTDLEIQEIREYGKILTDEERQLQKLKPSQEEVKKAEQTIEILTLIQEVI